MRPHCGSFDTLLYTLLVIACAWLVMTEAVWLAPGRVGAGLALTAVLPGFAFSKILFPNPDDIGLAERLAISMGASIAIVGLLVFVLSIGPWSVSRTPLVLGLLATCVLLTAVGRRLERRLRQDERPHRTTGGPSYLSFALTSLAIVVFVAGFWNVMAVLRQPGPATEFYLLDDGGTVMTGVPSSWTVGDELKLVVGITNREPGPTRFRIEVPGESAIHTPVLQAGKSWRKQIFVTVTPRLSARITLWLFRMEDDLPLRQLYLQGH